MASVVTRWSTTPHIKPQVLSDHSFYVALYTDFLCQLLTWGPQDTYLAVHWALIHDMPETVMSDTPGPVKRVIMDYQAFKKTEEGVFGEFGTGYHRDLLEQHHYDVVKAANIIDEVYYLSMECMLGNQFVGRVLINSRARLRRALEEINLTMVLDMIDTELLQMKQGVVSLITEEDPHGERGYAERNPVNVDH